MKHLFPFSACLVLLTLCACQASFFHLSDLETGPPISQPLPPLLIDWDWPSLQQSFPTTYESNEVDPSSELSPHEISYVSRTDVRLQDTRSLMEGEVRRNLCETLGAPQGFAVCRVIGQHTYHDLTGLTVLSLGSAFVLNVLGLPLGRQNTEVALELEIRDANDQLLAIYRGSGSGRVTTGLYYGRNGGRKTHVEACKEALAEIREQIARDAASLRTSLLASGPVK